MRLVDCGYPQARNTKLKNQSTTLEPLRYEPTCGKVSQARNRAIGACLFVGALVTQLNVYACYVYCIMRAFPIIGHSLLP